MQDIFLKGIKELIMDWIYGKTVLITGASSGIGRSLTVQLIREHNCKVIGIGQSEAKMKSIMDELSYQRDAFIYKIFDVSDQASWKNFAWELQETNIKVDILLNNAGMMPPFDKALNYSEEMIERCFDVNFHACRYAIKAMLPILRHSTMPAIINISSADALAAIVGTSVYAASKAAIKAYTEALIGELGREMYIGYICPGFVRTDIFRNQYFVSNTRLIKMMSTDVDKMAHKMIKRMIKQKARSIIGKDAKFMNFTSKFFPVLGLKFYEIIIKHYNVKMFENLR